MSGNPEAIPQCGTGLSWYALQRLPPLLDAFEKEIPGVRDADDIEFIHRMRVASRRLRAALPIFRSCFPQKQYARWMAALGGITRALGEARDADVQIAFLEKYRKNRKKNAASDNGPRRDTLPGGNTLDPALTYLLQERKDQRSRIQADVTAALDNLEKSGTIREMRAVFAGRSAAVSRTPVRSSALGIPTMAALSIAKRLESLLSFEPWVSHPDAVAEHHAMRIAAKKLRYTMEIYSPLYRRGLKKPHARVKKVQEILGDLHDCDVWIDYVTRLLLRERGRMRDGRRRPDTTTLAGLRLFLQERERARIQIHRRFMRYWVSLEHANIWEEIHVSLDGGRKKRFIPSSTGNNTEIMTAVIALAGTWPEGQLHHQTVTRLALALFDALKPVHSMDAHDRNLLEYAGMLHDIGWLYGSRRHNVRSALQIFSDETLPLDISDRSIVGLVSMAHRGEFRGETYPLFHLLPRERQEALLRLAAIIRIADGLDRNHTGVVREVRCHVEENRIMLEILSAEDVSQEKERARTRSGLFSRVFGKELVIP